MNEGARPLFSVEGLRKDYDSKAGRLPVLKGVHLDLVAGDMAFIVGRSGSGKSTLLHLLGGLDRPSGGKVLFEGQNLATMEERALARLRNQRLGYVFQFYHLLPELTLYENVTVPCRIARRENRAWIQEVLKRFGLWDRRDHYPSELSGGEQQRTAIARALANQPSVVLCDEPTGNLDGEAADSVLSLLTDLNRRDSQTFLIVTHDEALAWRYERVYRLSEGVLLGPERKHVNLKTV